MKNYLGYQGNNRAFLRMLQKLNREGYVKSIQGFGSLYWRYNIPST